MQSLGVSKSVVWDLEAGQGSLSDVVCPQVAPIILFSYIIVAPRLPKGLQHPHSGNQPLPRKLLGEKTGHVFQQPDSWAVNSRT